MPQCLHCGEQLVFAKERGYVHREEGAYTMRCPDCGWRGAPYPSPIACPNCGSRAVRDDHCATPKYGK